MQSRPLRSALVAAVIAVGLTPQAASAQHLVPRIDETFTEYRAGLRLDDGDRFGPWRVVFDGRRDGPAIRIGSGFLRLNPAPVRRASQTRAALVVSTERFTTRSLHLTATWTPRRTTRIGPANPWETGWLVWDYLSNDHFTYLALKPNGWEVGRRDPTRPGGQRFVRTGAEPITPMGTTRTVTVDRIGPQTTIRVDGEVLTTYRLKAGERTGSIGVYSEDAVVDVTEIYAATSRR